MEKMTSPQTWAIFCLSKIDVRQCALDREAASVIISALKEGGEAFNQTVIKIMGLQGAVAKGKAQPKQDWALLYGRARQAGLDAGQDAIPEPMVVQQRSDPFDDKSPVVRQYSVSEGVCGFAWVTVHPGNCSFALWARKQGLAKPHYGGGVSFWVSDFNQSMTRKEAYAEAFAEVLRQAGIKAYAGSRLD